MGKHPRIGPSFFRLLGVVTAIPALFFSSAELASSASKFPKAYSFINGSGNVGESLNASVVVMNTNNYSTSFVWWKCKREKKAPSETFPSTSGCKRAWTGSEYAPEVFSLGFHLLVQATVKIGKLKKDFYSKSIKVVQVRVQIPKITWLGRMNISGEFGQVQKLPRPSSSSGAKVLLESESKAICNVLNESTSSSNDFELRLERTGQCLLRGYPQQSKGWNWSSQLFALEVEAFKRSQTIKFVSPIQVVFTTQKFVDIDGPTSDSGLQVSIESLTPEICLAYWNEEISIKIHRISDGTCSLKYSQPGDSETNPADSKTISFPITFDKANSKPYPMLTFATSDYFPLEGDSFILDYPLSNGDGAISLSSDSPDVCSIQVVSVRSVRLSTIHGGTCYIRAVQIESDYWFGATTYLSFTVSSKLYAPSLLAAVPLGLKKYCPYIFDNRENRTFLDWPPDWTIYTDFGKQYVRYNSIWGTMLFNYERFTGLPNGGWVFTPANLKAMEAWDDWGCTPNFKVWN